MVVFGANIAAMCAAEQPNVIKVDEQDHFHEDWIPPFDFRDGVRIKTNEKFSDYYELFEEIGEGKFGKVYRCLERRTNLLLAAKCIRLKRDADFEKVEKEVNIMTQMRHKCITQIYDAFATSTNDVILIMEIVEGGELFDRVVDENYILTEMAVAMIVYQICEAIRYIHSQNIIHLDLKPENIMCSTQTGNQIKLIDFGLAQYYDGQSDLLFMAGTPEFAAPEVIKYEPLDFHTDMWSVGVITYILLSGQSPFLGENVAHTYCNVERGTWEFCEEFKENCISQEAQDFISKLLIVEKNKRMCPQKCLQHQWLVKFLKLSRQNADQVIKEKPLDVEKLRYYVRNKRFRRLVFGVLFVNSIVRMISTLQDRKSDNGIKYVKNMLSAVKNENSRSKDKISTNLSKIMSKQKQNDELNNNLKLTSVRPLNLPDANNFIKFDSLNATVSNTQTNSKQTSIENEIDAKNHDDELSEPNLEEDNRRLSKRINYCEETTENSTTEILNKVLSNESKNEKLHSTLKKNENIKKTKRVKLASSKTSSTIQAPNKRTKTTRSLHKIDSTENSALDTYTMLKKSTTHNNEKTKESPTISPLKLNVLSQFEQKTANLPAPYQLPVTSAILKKTKKQSQIENIENATNKKIEIEPVYNNELADNNKKLEKKKKTLNKVKKLQKNILTLDDERQKILSATKVLLTQQSGSGITNFNFKEETLPQLLTASENLSENNRLKTPTIIVEDKYVKQNKLYSKQSRDYSHSNDEKKLQSHESDKSSDKNKKSLVSSLIKKLELNDTSDLSGIKIAVSGFIPPKLMRHKSADYLNKPSANNQVKKDSLNRSKSTSIVLEDNVKETVMCLKEKTFKLLPLKLKIKTVSEKNIILAQKSTLVGIENDRKSISLLDLNALEISTIRQNLHSTETINSKKKKKTTHLLQSKVGEINLAQSSIEVIDANYIQMNEESTDLSKKIVVKTPMLKKKLIKRSLVEKRAMQRSLGSLTEQNKSKNNSLHLIAEEGKNNVSFSEELFNNSLEWTPRSKHNSLTTLAEKEQQEEFSGRQLRNKLRPKSEMNLAPKHNSKCDNTGTSFDAFDFNFLRMKLQQRIMGLKDDDDLATKPENRHKCQLRVQHQNSANVKQTMEKWLNMDKHSSIQES